MADVLRVQFYSGLKKEEVAEWGGGYASGERAGYELVWETAQNGWVNAS
jgi:hypothetical protein